MKKNMSLSIAVSDPSKIKCTPHERIFTVSVLVHAAKQHLTSFISFMFHIHAPRSRIKKMCQLPFKPSVVSMLLVPCQPTTNQYFNLNPYVTIFFLVDQVVHGGPLTCKLNWIIFQL